MSGVYTAYWAVWNFWQEYPKSLSITPEEIRVGLWLRVDRADYEMSDE